MHKTIRSVDVYYEQYGEGIPIIMIHGFSPDSQLMIGCMEPVFDKKSPFSRIYLDLPGMGKTENYDSIQNADHVLTLLIEFIEAVIPDEKFILAGESYGGYLARAIAAKCPDRVLGMLLICPVIYPEKEKRTLPKQEVMYQDEAFVRSLSKEDKAYFSKSGVILTSRNWNRFLAEVMSGIIHADGEFLDRLAQNYALSFDPDENASFDVPGLFLFGRQDDHVGYTDGLCLLEKYPHASFAILDFAGHNLQIEQAKIFTTMVQDFLFRVKPE
ncbi:alpha/beta hydrolase [Listeria ivanovii]|uniref:alpha/beta fold hydrolase n=1 Tax=Listeria ivanovii TaxID=1638 RepID=UPI000DA7009B|nr:alpha/beta hydrolase [Listeria ivanovii]PZF87393.1 alpha/beta hydrolase [Listeria ivanovii]PZF92429.1 alpha/beta hydrolase [Listeria ivanovii]PZG03543.1 alpha/beta hydrolase [Listeria ivanovii]PZG07780.1 alpha/beta hydrolase [Listeria ivanovii]PZG24677.1 alpha/beta hydrolase [Listeria ivanovii]